MGKLELEAIVVPPERLAFDTLVALVDAFVLREGTDYGYEDATLEEKRAQVLRQLERGEVKIVFDARTEEVELVLARDLSPSSSGA